MTHTLILPNKCRKCGGTITSDGGEPKCINCGYTPTTRQDQTPPADPPAQDPEKAPAQEDQRRKWLRENRDKILAYYIEYGREKTLEKYGISAYSLGQLVRIRKRQRLQQTAAGIGVTMKNGAVVDGIHRIPRADSRPEWTAPLNGSLPAWSDNWTPEVQIKWLDCWLLTRQTGGINGDRIQWR